MRTFRVLDGLAADSRLGGFDGFDADLFDSAAVHLGDGHLAAFVGDAFAAFGDFAEAGEQEAGEGFYAGVAGQAPLHLGFEVAEVDAAFKEQCA